MERDHPSRDARETSKDDARVGLVGVGLVGTALARLLVTAGYEVHGYDIKAERLAALAELGGVPETSPAAVARAAPRVFLSLLTTAIGREVLEGADGILTGAGPQGPAFIVDTTTGHPAEMVALGRLVADRGGQYLDATISGSSRVIARREGVFMVGGAREAFEACRDLFVAVAGRTFYLGPSGNGARAKLAVNLVLGLNRLALAEGLVFAEAAGLNLAEVLPVFQASAAYSRAMDHKGANMIAGEYPTAARLAQHLKDVGIILGVGDERGLDLPLSRTHRAVLEAAVAAGMGDWDNSAVIEELRRRWRGNGPEGRLNARRE